MSSPKNAFCNKKIKKVVPSFKTNIISQIKQFSENGSIFKILLMPTKITDLETFVVNDFLEFKTDFDGCLGFSQRLCHDSTCSSDSTLAGVSLFVQETPSLIPNAITGIPIELKLSIEKLNPFSSFIYIGGFSD